VWASTSEEPRVPREPVRAPLAAPTAGGRARVESILSAWTLVRHAGQPLSRPVPRTIPLRSAELRVSGSPLPVFIEPLPEVIARLVGVVRQLRRGLEVLGPLAPSSSATALLVEIEDIVRVALHGAARHASDELMPTEEASALASLPARIARAEEDSGADLGPVVAVVYSDPVGQRVLASGTGSIEPVLMFAREANKEEPLLVVGAHLAHHELIERLDRAPGSSSSHPALTDATWRGRFRIAPSAREGAVGATGAPAALASSLSTTQPSPSVPARPSWVGSFRWVKPAARTAR
jgi:hypothetical protein